MSRVRPARLFSVGQFSVGQFSVGLIGLALCVLDAALAPANLMGQPPDDARFADHLATGEFGPALGIASRSATAAQRDARLARVAEAQIRAGARQASLGTASSIGSDRARSATFDSLGSHPFFGGGARGGAALADFDSLIELIQTTVAPDSWVDAGGTGAIESFATGVIVDSSGMLRRVASRSSDDSLAAIRRSSLVMSGNRDVRQKSVLRKVSLTRLERHAQRMWAMGKRPDEAMRVLAGLTKINYVLVHPESRDIVLVGPADDWIPDSEGRLVNVASRQPVMQLDDLVVVLRNAYSAGGVFGCSINPRQENLASIQSFLQDSSRRSLKPNERSGWLAELRNRLGTQDIKIFGIDPRTRVARILVEADYHMKLVGMGLEPGTLGVTSYLDSVRIPPGESPPPMDVLRWWFTLNFEPTRTTPARDIFELVGPGAKVLSENELLAERGERVHTGDASNLNRQFALSFTKHFGDLAIKYPIYAEMRNIFEMAMVAGIIREEDLAGRGDWHLTFFGPQGKYEVQRDLAPTQVESIINYRLIDRRHLIVGVSGGVSVNTQELVKASSTKTDHYGLLTAEHATAAPPDLPTTAWWWD